MIMPQVPANSGETAIHFTSDTTTMADYANRRDTIAKETNNNAIYATSVEDVELAEHNVNCFAYEGYKVDSTTSSPIQESPNFESRPMRRSTASRRSSGAGHGGEEVVVCSANAAFKRTSTLLRMKTKSRLSDQPDFNLRTSGSGNGVGDIDEDDLLIDDDLPDEYKKLRYSKWTLLQLISLILIVGCLACTLAIPRFRNKDLYDLDWWKWEVMLLVVICGRLVSGWVIRILVFFLERRFLLRKRVLYFVYGLKKAVQNCIWLTLVLIAWQCIFDKKVKRMSYGKKVLPRVTAIWICLLVGTLVWLLKTLLIEVLALNFHVSKYFDRIQDSLFNQFVIETLSGPVVIGIQKEYEEDDWGMEDIEKLENIGTPRSRIAMVGKTEVTVPKNSDKYNGIRIDQLHRLNQNNISAWNMNRMMNAINTSMLTTVDEQFQDAISDEDETFMHITSDNEAKVAAKKIFCNVVEPRSKYIYLEDLMRFFPEDEALKMIRLFDEASETKGISKQALKNWVVNVFRERRALALSLKDTKTAVDKLHQMLNAVVGIVIIVISLLILKVATSQFFIFLSSQLVLVAFVFGNTCKTMFEAIIFLFIVHPFDVGDRCEIDGVQMIVEEMNILTTIFLRYDNQKISYPNSVLSTMPIANYNRSPDMGEAIDFCIHVSTPAEKVAKMKEMITSYVEKKSSHWQPRPVIVVRDVEDLNRLKMSIWLSHRMNFQDMGERWKRRALLMEEMIKIFKDLDIEYRMLPLDINVRYMPELTSNRFPSNWAACAT
ncbi:putative mechanosensitive ion channel MscS, LSM domain superfamily [Helianthus annuus]|nr:putative mechanosensitive ion channel MscS, LSM domain superfamily [Helianthus annuus]